MTRRITATKREFQDGVSLMLNCHMDAQGRDVCDYCRKVAFRSRELAETRTADLNELQPPRSLFYSACDGGCGYWHLTTIWTER